MPVTGCQPRHQPMRYARTLAVAATAAFGMMLPGAAWAAQSGHDYDCTDFDSRGDAQAFYEAMGGPVYDPFNLDDDGDGVACEEWARDYERTAAGERGINGQDGIDMDCDDFSSQEEAQRYFSDDGGSRKKNVDHLDPNHNGIACEDGEPG